MRFPTDEDLLNPEQESELDLSSLLSAEQPQPSLPPGPQAGLAKLAELYAAQQQAEQSGPGASEQEYLAQNQPQAGWKNVLGAVGSAIAESTGSKGALDRFHANQQAGRKAYERGLEQARGIDMGRRPVDRSVAELAVMAGISPEAAKSMTRDSDGLRLLNSGMGQLGARYRQQDLTAEQKAAERELKPTLEEGRQGNRVELERLRQEGREKLKSMPKPGASGGGGGGGAGGMTPEERQSALAGVFAQQANVSKDQAAAFLAGNSDGIEPDALSRLQGAKDSWALMDSKKRQAALSSSWTREGGTRDRVDAAIETKQRDPNKRMEYETQIDESHRAISEAINAWNTMTPAGKEALAQLSGESWASGTLRDAKMSPDDMAKAGAIQALANRLIKQTSGAAVSDSEWVRIAREMGLASNNFDVLKGTGAVDRWLKSSQVGWARNKRKYDEIFNNKKEP